MTAGLAHSKEKKCYCQNKNQKFCTNSNSPW